MPKSVKRSPTKKEDPKEVLDPKFNITRGEVQEIVRLRTEKVPWQTIIDSRNRSVPWVHAIRRIMKQLDPSTVAKSYDRGTSTRASKPRAPRAPKEKKEQTTIAKTKAGRSVLVEEVWSLDTPESRIREILDGRTITVAYDLDGIKMAPFDLRIKIIKSIKEAKSGKVVDFLDTDQKYHAVNFRYITDIR